MIYKINLSKTSVIHRGKIYIQEINTNRKYTCGDVTTCTNNIECDECIFNGDNKIAYEDVMKRVLE